MELREGSLDGLNGMDYLKGMVLLSVSLSLIYLVLNIYTGFIVMGASTTLFETTDEAIAWLLIVLLLWICILEI